MRDVSVQIELWLLSQEITWRPIDSAVSVNAPAPHSTSNTVSPKDNKQIKIIYSFVNNLLPAPAHVCVYMVMHVLQILRVYCIVYVYSAASIAYYHVCHGCGWYIVWN